MWIVEALMSWFVAKNNTLETVRPLASCLAQMFPITTSYFLNSLHYWRWLSSKQARAAGQHPARENPKHVPRGPLALTELIW